MYVNFPKGKKLLLQQQLMSDLPEAQSALFDAPFNHTEVDYFDPITIKRKNGPEQVQEPKKGMVSF